MSDIKIKDNYLKSHELRHVQDLFGPVELGNRIQNEIGVIPWRLGEILNYSTGDIDELDNYQLSSILYQSPDSNIGADPYTTRFNQFLFPMFFREMDPRCLLKVKVNLQMRTTEIRKNGFHCDYPPHFSGAKTSIFYINSNDGYTEFEDGTKIESVANRLITFPQQMEHRGTSCTNKPFRLVINFNYF